MHEKDKTTACTQLATAAAKTRNHHAKLVTPAPMPAMVGTPVSLHMGFLRRAILLYYVSGLELPHAVPDKWNPSAHEAHFARPSLLQEVPTAGDPLEHVHTFAATVRDTGQGLGVGIRITGRGRGSGYR